MTGFTRKLLVVLLINVFAFNVGAFAEEDKNGEGTKEELTLSQKIDNKFRPVVDAIAAVLFVDPFEKLGLHDPTVRDSAGNPVINAKGEIVTHQIPLVVIWLISG